MSTSDEFKQRIEDVLAEARAQNHKLSDVIPVEVQDHFRDVEALQNAKGLIEDLEHEKQQFQEKTQSLQRQLQQAQQVEIPADQAALQVDLEQALHRIDFYTNLMNVAENRANQNQEKLREALEVQAVSAETEKKIKRLENENRDLQTTVERVVAQEESNKGLSDQMLRHQDDTIQTLKICIQEKDDIICERVKAIDKLTAENDAVEKLYEGLMELMQRTEIETTNSLNTTGSRLHAAQQLQDAIFMQTKPILNFYVCANDVLSMYKDFFKQLLNVTDENASNFPDKLEHVLHAAEIYCSTFYQLRAELDPDLLLRSTQNDQLSKMIHCAEDMLTNLTAIAGDARNFLSQLDRQPDLVQLLRMKFRR